MKKYNEVIKINVSVDSMAHKLLSLIDPKFENKELLVETIIDQALENDSMNILHTILYSPMANLKVGDTIACNAKISDYSNVSDDEPKTREIGICEVIAIEPNHNKIRVQYEHTHAGGTTTMVKTWVHRDDCYRVPLGTHVALEDEHNWAHVH